jgi:hypothetical protein
LKAGLGLAHAALQVNFDESIALGRFVSRLGCDPTLDEREFVPNKCHG